MNAEKQNFEVETRYRFADKQEVFTMLPFLAAAFHDRNAWHTVHYGLELFKRDVILRINESCRDGETKSSLGWKSPDFGEVVNVREELDEDITCGITNSRVLALFGIEGNFPALADVSDALTHRGCCAFMEFTGANEFGFYVPLGLQLKLMHCSELKYPYMLEIEKTAHDVEEALQMEAELQAFTCQYKLADREVKAEPPTLLYRICCQKG